MGVFIKGMEMPKNCAECKIKGEGSDSLYTWSCPFTGFEYTRYDCVNDRLDDCPLIEVPTPHGRLIDADALLSDDEIVQILTSNPQRTGKLIKEFAEMFVDKTNRQPTIIEAEGSDT